MRQQEEEVQKLRDQVSVLAHAKETDARRLRHIATERHRERQDLKGEVDSLKVQQQHLALTSCAELAGH